MIAELAQRISQLQAIAAAATTGNLEKTYEESMEVTRDALGAQVASLQLLDQNGRDLRFVATLIPEELPRLQQYDPIPVDEASISGLVVKSGKAVWFSDSWQDPSFGKRQRQLAQESNLGNRSYICVPLKARGRLLGVLSVLDKEPHKFTEDDKDLMGSVASFVAMAVDRAQFEERLRDVAAAVSSSDLSRVYAEAMAAIRSLLHAEVASLQLLDNEGKELTFVATLVPEELTRLQEYGPIPVDESSISGYVVQNGEAVLFSDSWEDPVFGIRQRRIAQEKNVANRSYICVPLKARAKTIGVLSILHREPHMFSNVDLGLTIILASFIAVAIQNARNTSDLLEAQKRQANIERAVIMADIANNIVHRINNDLGFIQAAIRQLESRRDADNLDSEYLWKKLVAIKEVSNQTIDLVKGFKDFDRLKRKAEFVNVKSCVNGAIQALRSYDREIDAIVKTDFPQDTILVYATQELTGVFENLIRNARDAMPETVDRQIRIALENVFADYLMVSVVDNGPGVPAHIRNDLFQLGVTTKPTGMGFGLWWVQLWLQRYGGKIYHDETYSDGARFILELPMGPSHYEDML